MKKRVREESSTDQESSESTTQSSDTESHQRSRRGDPTETHPRVPSEVTDAFIETRAGAAALTTTEDWVRQNSKKPFHDGRSPTRTYFNANDADSHYPPGQENRDPDEKRSWATLAKWQDGMNSDISRGGQNWWADKQRWTETFADCLYATDYHADRCKYILERIDMQPYQSGQIPVELVIVGILSLLIDADVTDFDNRTLNRDGTKDLLSDLDSSVSEFENVRKLLRKHDSGLLFPE